jgi:Integrase core domain/Integrase zinc binding domain
LPLIAAKFDLAAFAAAQAVCPEVASMRKAASLDVSYRLVGEVYLYGDISTPVFQPLVPVAYRRPIFDVLHAAGHPSVRASRRLVSSRFVGPKLAQQVTTWARECVACQRAKMAVHAQPAAAATIPVPAHRFAHINIDMVGPLPMLNSFTHLFTIIDQLSWWPEAIPVTSTTTAACASALFHHWISRFGVPAAITSDRGAQFTSSLWAAMCQQFDIHRFQTLAYHP